MPEKIKTITLSKTEDSYRVEAIMNSIDYLPGDFLSHEEVVKLCNVEHWVVTITRRNCSDDGL